jgi:hypothetical protein
MVGLLQVSALVYNARFLVTAGACCTCCGMHCMGFAYHILVSILEMYGCRMKLLIASLVIVLAVVIFLIACFRYAKQ